jgi:hypothetical protein
MHAFKKISWEKGLDSIFLEIRIFKCNFGIPSPVRKITLLRKNLHFPEKNQESRFFRNVQFLESGRQEN